MEKIWENSHVANCPSSLNMKIALGLCYNILRGDQLDGWAGDLKNGLERHKDATTGEWKKKTWSEMSSLRPRSSGLSNHQLRVEHKLNNVDFVLRSETGCEGIIVDKSHKLYLPVG